VRLNHEQLELIKEKLGVDTLWSYSKVSTFSQCTWLFKLKYIDKVKVQKDNVYTFFGNIAHDIIQGLYEKKHEYKDMINIFEQKVLEWRVDDNPKLKFSSDKERDGYIENLKHYFTHTDVIPYNVVNEKPVIAVFQGKDKYVFQGYVDTEYTDDKGNLIILDYKTSSMSGFTGKKLIEKSKQLIIYAIGISQFRKIPLEKIRIRYDMMKYCNVSYMQKNGKIKTTKAERRLWVAKISNQIRKDLERLGIDPITIDGMVKEAINRNTLDNMPKEVQDKYTISNCYIDIQLTDEVVKELESELTSTLDKIVAKSKEEDVEEAFARNRIEQSDSYYCTNLCDARDHCKYYKEYKEHSTMFLDKKDAPSEDELLAMLGLV
jgi:PD-(D/E)XK nuclease superfamily